MQASLVLGRETKPVLLAPVTQAQVSMSKHRCVARASLPNDIASYISARRDLFAEVPNEKTCSINLNCAVYHHTDCMCKVRHDQAESEDRPYVGQPIRSYQRRVHLGLLQ